MEQEFSVRKLRDELIAKHNDAMERLVEYEETLDKVLDAMPTDSVKRFETSSIGFEIGAAGVKAILVACIRALRINGFEAESKPMARQTSYGAYFYNEERVCIWFFFSSTQCRQVAVGKRMIEETIYETVCDEQIYESATA